MDELIKQIENSLEELNNLFEEFKGLTAGSLLETSSLISETELLCDLAQVIDYEDSEEINAYLQALMAQIANFETLLGK